MSWAGICASAFAQVNHCLGQQVESGHCSMGTFLAFHNFLHLPPLSASAGVFWSPHLPTAPHPGYPGRLHRPFQVYPLLTGDRCHLVVLGKSWCLTGLRDRKHVISDMGVRIFITVLRVKAILFKSNQLWPWIGPFFPLS